MVDETPEYDASLKGELRVVTDSYDGPYPTDEAQLLHVIARDVKAIRQSQENTEKMVRDFISQMSQNPMLRMMAGRLGT